LDVAPQATHSSNQHDIEEMRPDLIEIMEDGGDGAALPVPAPIRRRRSSLVRQSTALKGSSSRIGEMFYAGARYVSCGHSYRTYDWDAADTLVDLLLEGSEPQGSVSP
jgi:hypothetical protein